MKSSKIANRKATFLEDLLSLVYAGIASILVYGLWQALVHDFAVSVILIGLALYVLVFLAVAHLATDYDWLIDLNGYRWQAAPIAAAGLITGWTAQSGDMSIEENAILLAVSAVFALFSIATLSESLCPHFPKGHQSYEVGANGQRRKLFFRLIIVQFLIAGGIGACASWGLHSKAVPEEPKFCYSEPRVFVR